MTPRDSQDRRSVTDDRTVHGKVGISEVVRYDRSGKWYIESPGGRRHVGVNEAARYIVDSGYGFAHIGRPGGKVFDRQVLRLRGVTEA